MAETDWNDPAWDAPLTPEQWRAAKFMFEDRSEEAVTPPQYRAVNRDAEAIAEGRRMGDDWWGYVRRIAGHEATQTDIAERAGLDPSSVNRWKKGKSEPTAKQVVGFARSYGSSPLEALVAAGYLTPDDIKSVQFVRASASELSLAELFDEIRRRLEDLGAL